MNVKPNKIGNTHLDTIKITSLAGDYVVDIVATYFKISADDLHSAHHSRLHSEERWVAAAVLVELGCTHVAAAAVLGKDRSSITTGLASLAARPALRQHVASILALPSITMLQETGCQMQCSPILWHIPEAVLSHASDETRRAISSYLNLLFGRADDRHAPTWCAMGRRILATDKALAANVRECLGELQIARFDYSLAMAS